MLMPLRSHDRITVIEFEGMRMRIVAASVLTIALGQAVPAMAASTLPWEPQPPRIIEDRFRIELAVVNANFDTRARVDGGTEFPGTEFDAEDDFGLAESKFMFLPELTLLPGERHLIRLNGLSLDRHASKAVERPIEYDADTFDTGDLVDSTLDLRLIGLTYGYRFARFERFEATGLLGVQIADFTTNAEIHGQSMREPSGEITPIPLLGLELRFDLTRRLSMELGGQYMSVSYADITGKISDLRVAATWRLNPHLVVGLGYRSLSLSAESEEEDSAGMADFQMTAPTLFFRASL